MADYKHIIRVVNTDLDGSKPIYHALTKIKGVGVMMANATCNAAKIKRTLKAGDLEQEAIAKLNDVILHPGDYDIPEWLFNRKKDPETGEDKHLASGELRFNQENDVKMLKKIKCYRGVRHMFGLPTRGQRTKSNFRRNKGSVMGVKRKGKKSGRV
jgi:small subunit ribosomal protein S13